MSTAVFPVPFFLPELCHSLSRGGVFPIPTPWTQQDLWLPQRIKCSRSNVPWHLRIGEKKTAQFLPTSVPPFVLSLETWLPCCEEAQTSHLQTLCGEAQIRNWDPQPRAILNHQTCGPTSFQMILTSTIRSSKWGPRNWETSISHPCCTLFEFLAHQSVSVINSYLSF